MIACSNITKRNTNNQSKKKNRKKQNALTTYYQRAALTIRTQEISTSKQYKITMTSNRNSKSYPLIWDKVAIEQ